MVNFDPSKKVEADAAWDGSISNSVRDAKEFEKLTDSILRTIESSSGDDPRLARSRAIIRRIRKRELYRFVDEVIVTGALKSHIRKPTAEDIAAYVCRWSFVVAPRQPCDSTARAAPPAATLRLYYS